MNTGNFRSLFNLGVWLTFFAMCGCHPFAAVQATNAAVTTIQFSSFSVPTGGGSIVIEFQIPASSTLSPATGITGFSVAVNGSAVTVSSASLSASSEVTLALAVPIFASDTVTVSYAAGNLTDAAASNVLPTLAIQNVSNQSAFDADVEIYYQTVGTNGGSVSLSSLTAVQTLVTSLKTNGVWTKLIEIYPFVGTGLASALTKLKTAAGSPTSLTNQNFLLTDYNETGASGGFQGDGSTKYLDTGLSIPTLTQTSMSVGAYVNVDSTTAVPAGGIIGSSYVVTGATDRFYLWGTGSSTGNWSGQCGLAADYAAGRVAGIGLRSMTYDGTTLNAYQNAVNSYTIALSGATWQQVGTVQIFRAGGSTYAGLHNGRMSFAFVGTALTQTDLTNLYSAIQAFQTALNRQI